MTRYTLKEPVMMHRLFIMLMLASNTVSLIHSAADTQDDDCHRITSVTTIRTVDQNALLQSIQRHDVCLMDIDETICTAEDPFFRACNQEEYRQIMCRLSKLSVEKQQEANKVMNQGRYAQVAIEPELGDLIKEMQKKGCSVYGCTGRPALPKIKEWTHENVQVLGISFNKGETLIDIDVKHFEKGTFFCDYTNVAAKDEWKVSINHKSSVLKNILRSLVVDQELPLQNVFMFDDNKDYLQKCLKVVKRFNAKRNHAICFQGIHYNAVATIMDNDLASSHIYNILKTAENAQTKE